MAANNMKNRSYGQAKLGSQRCIIPRYDFSALKWVFISLLLLLFFAAPFPPNSFSAALFPYRAFFLGLFSIHSRRVGCEEDKNRAVISSIFRDPKGRGSLLDCYRGLVCLAETRMF